MSSTPPGGTPKVVAAHDVVIADGVAEAEHAGRVHDAEQCGRRGAQRLAFDAAQPDRGGEHRERDDGDDRRPQGEEPEELCVHRQRNEPGKGDAHIIERTMA